MRQFIEAFYRYRNHPDFTLEDNVLAREMGFAVGEQHWRIRITDLMRWEIQTDAATGLPEIYARLREDHRAFYNDFFEARRQCAIRFLRDRDIIRPGETYQQGTERRKTEKAKAEECARQLLLEFLTEAQRETLREKHYFDVRGPNNELFRIEDAAHSNVYLLDEDENQLARFCRLVYGVPRSDSLLAQKLALETQPEEFMAAANPVPAIIEDYVAPGELERQNLELHAQRLNNNERFGMTPEEIERLREEARVRDFDNHVNAMEILAQRENAAQPQGA